MNSEETELFRHSKRNDDFNISHNLIKNLENRSLGHVKDNAKLKDGLYLYAEEEFINKEEYDELQCEMPGMPRSTFLMVFSPDGTKVASTHGNHNIYVTDLCSGKNIKTLVGHPRTPWCVAFHPTSNQIIASGCLGGQVRIWDLSGGSEVWTAENQSVIASIAFHPSDRILVIATINEIHFWDWNESKPFCYTATSNQKEKVRFVSFDKLGQKLITGISNSQSRWEYVRSSVPSPRPVERSQSPYRRRITHRIFNFPLRRSTPQTSTSNNNIREPPSSIPQRERNISLCYRNLVREYGRLVRRYLQLYRPPAMVDRGTDPMEENTLTSTSSTQIPERSPINQPGPSRITDSSPSTSNQNRLDDNPYQFLTPSRIVAVMNRPATLIRGTQTSESRKHKAQSSSENNPSNSEKKLKTHSSSSMKSPSVSFMATGEDQPHPSASNMSSYISDQSEEEHVLEDIIRGASTSQAENDLSTLLPSVETNSILNDSVLEPNAPNLTESVVTNPDEPVQLPSNNHLQGNSCVENENHDVIDNESSFNFLPEPISNNGTNSSKETSEITPGCSKEKTSNESSSSDISDREEPNKKLNRSSTPQQNTCKDEQNRVTINESHSITSNNENTIVNSSLPSTSRGNTGSESRAREATRFELLMASIRNDAENNFRARLLPLIQSVPEQERLEMIRIFVQGLRESRERGRTRHRNTSHVLNKKTNRRPMPGTSSDTSSSEDEQDSVNDNSLAQEVINDRRRLDESANRLTWSSIPKLQPRTECNRDAFHNINNLENWVTSLFDDVDPHQINSINTSENGTTREQSATSVSSTGNDNSMTRPSRLNRLLAARRLYSHRMNRDRVHPRNCVNSSRIPSASMPPQSNSSNSTGIANTRTTGSSFSRRRFGIHRTSAFLPTRVYYPRHLTDSRRNRQFLFGRWRLNSRLYRSYSVSDRFSPRSVGSNNSSNFASDEVINFSEFPNSEDDPVPSAERRTATNPSYYSYQFHPFNPPPDLPTINPENIGIGNMYSNIIQDLEVSLNDVRNIRAGNRPGEMSDMLNSFSERLENIMNQSEAILRNLRTSVDMLPGNDLNISGERSSTPSASFNDENFYIRDQRIEVNDLRQSMNNILDENPSNNVTSDHTYPRNSDSSASSSSSNSTMSPLMTSLHLTISHIQRQARLLRHQVGSIERIDRAMVEVAQLQLIRLLLVELSRYVRNMSGESRSTSMSSVRQMMAGTKISDSSPGESQSSDNGGAAASALPPQPSTSNASNVQNNLPSARTRGLSHKTYPPSRLNRLHKRKAMSMQNVPRHFAVRIPPALRRPSVTLTLDRQSMLHIYSRINNLTLCRMSRRLDELIAEQVKVFMQRQLGQNNPTVLSDSNIREQNIAVRLRESIARTNRLVGNIFDANIVRNYRMETSTVSSDGFDRLYARQTLSFIIDGISTHLDETRSSPLTHNIRLELQSVMRESLLLSELLLLQIVDSIPPASGTSTDINLDQERQNLISRINQMCTTMMMSSRLGEFSIHLTHSLRQLQTLIRQNSILSQNNSRSPMTHVRYTEPRSRLNNRTNRLSMFSRMRNTLHTLPSRLLEPTFSDHFSTSISSENNASFPTDIYSEESMNRSFGDMPNSFQNILNTVQEQSLQNVQGGSHILTDDNDEVSGDQEQRSANIGTSALEARVRDFQRDILDRVRTSIRPTTNTLYQRYQRSPSQNSESDDGVRQIFNDQRRDVQIPSSSSDIGSRQQNSFSVHDIVEEGQVDLWTAGSSFSSNLPMPASNRFASNSSSTNQPTTNNSEGWTGSSRWSYNLPSVHVNDVPVSELGSSSENSELNNSPSVTNNSLSNPMIRIAAMRTANHPLGVFRPRFLHPLYSSVNPFDADLDDPQREHIYDSDVITTVTPNHRIQIWDISDSTVPIISNPLKNVVVGECKIHNDASVDIASDGSILVTLLPSGGYLNVTNRLGVYSLKWETLGQCLYTTNFDYNAVSVSLSPSGRHLVVGLASRRAAVVPSERRIMARIFKIEQKDIPGDRLPMVKEIDQAQDGRATIHKSVNCIRWLPSSGQGLIYATNTGQLVIWT